MSKHLSPHVFYDLPSGSRVHPNRLIQRDGSLMWKHALCNNGVIHLPQSEAHEAHIIKTAHRLEELNCWVSQGLEPWEFLEPSLWYCIDHKHKPFTEGYACQFTHTNLSNECIQESLQPHIQSHEKLKVVEGQLYFQRC